MSSYSNCNTCTHKFICKYETQLEPYRVKITELMKKEVNGFPFITEVSCGKYEYEEIYDGLRVRNIK